MPPDAPHIIVKAGQLSDGQRERIADAIEAGRRRGGWDSFLAFALAFSLGAVAVALHHYFVLDRFR